MLKMSYQKLQIWQKSMFLAKQTYQITKRFPKAEVYGLTSQMRGASISIPSNIAEGSQRGSNKEFLHFIAISRGSLVELETQFILAHDIGYLDETVFKNTIHLTEEIGRMMNSFANRLRTIH